MKRSKRSTQKGKFFYEKRFFGFVVVGIFLVLSIGGIFALETNFPSRVGVFPFTVIYSNYDGITTNFASLGDGEIESVAGVVLERVGFGRIMFTENLDLLNISGADRILDFDSDVNISDNLIFVDEVDLSGIDKGAVLYLHNLNYTDPFINHNGGVCSDCSIISYSSGTLVFAVTSLGGAYYVTETPVGEYCGDNICNNAESYLTCPSDCEEPVPDPDPDPDDGGGGGGGGGVPTDTPDDSEKDLTEGGKYNFTLNPKLIEMELRKGSYFRKNILITNTGEEPLELSVDVTGISEFVFPERRSLVLPGGGEHNLRLDIYVSDRRAADVYPGKIVVSARGIAKYADAILQVNERDALFDIKTDILKKYINPSGRVRANVSLINMGDLRNFDVNLEYKILDFDKNEHTIKEEQFAINTTYSNVFHLDLPRDIPTGNYIFYSTVRYKDVNATSYDTFVVENISTYAWILLIAIIIASVILLYGWYMKKKAAGEIEGILNKSTKTPQVEKKEVKEVTEVEELPLLP